MLMTVYKHSRGNIPKPKEVPVVKKQAKVKKPPEVPKPPRSVFLDGDTVYLRLVKPEDERTMAQWICNSDDSDVQLYLKTLKPAAAKTKYRQAWKTAQLNDRRHVNFVFAIMVKSTNTYIGNIGIYKVDWGSRTGILGVVIGEKDFRKNGYAPDAAKLLLEYAFERLKLRKITSRVRANHRPSVRLYENKLKFKSEGRLQKQLYIDKKYVDMILFALFRDDWGKLQ